MAERATAVLGQNFKAQALIKGERFQDLDRRQTYFDCTQHDWKRYDFDGRPCRPGPVTQQPLLTSEVAPFFVPLRQRRPSSPYRIGKAIVDAFTTLLYGEERWPRFLCPGDADTQDYADALQKEANLLVKMTEARNLGGSMGSVGLSWCFREGKPRVEVHNAKNLYVHEWKDREALVPRLVSEIYLYPVDEYDAQKGKMVRNQYWYRHDWTDQQELAYEPILFKREAEPQWVVNDEDSVDHQFGFTPFVWVQNLPNTDIDGTPDYHGQYEAMDTLDVIASVIARGTILNLDPTLVLKMDPSIVKRVGVKKGSDNALAVGEAGDAKYLELAGTGIDAGIKAFQLKRRSVLEATQCVIPDPDEIAAAGTSSVAIKAIYQPMLGKAALHRSQYGTAKRRVLEGMLEVARDRVGQTVSVTVPADLDADPPQEEATTQEAIQYIDLPPRLEKKKPEPKKPELDDFGRPKPPDPAELQKQQDAKPEYEKVERTPGEGEQIELGWGEWFPLTPQDRNQAVQALQLASGAKPVLSQQTATEEAAVIFNRNPDEEWEKLQSATQQDEAKQAQQQQDMFPPAGGGLAIGADGKLKPAGTPKPPGGKPPKFAPQGPQLGGDPAGGKKPPPKTNPFG